MRCPRCGASLLAQMRTCPQCALGLLEGDRPGILLAVAPRGEVLCTRCSYREDCNLPAYPEAERCTLYRDEALPEVQSAYQPPMSRRFWSVPLLFAILLLISWLLTLRS